MRNVARAKWVASFDMEDLIGSILRNGTLISIGLVIASLALRMAGPVGFEEPLQGTNVLRFMLVTLHQAGSPRLWPPLLARLGVAVLLLTPYVRVIASTFYFAYVERSVKHSLLTGCVLTMLTYILFLG